MEHQGLPAEHLQLLYANSASCKLVCANKGSFKVDNENRKLGPLQRFAWALTRQTGGSDTSFGNSLVVLAAILQALSEAPEGQSFESAVESFRLCGYKLKLDFVDHQPNCPIDNFHISGTFLKGRMIADPSENNKWVFTPCLPSAFLKRFGSVGTDPRVIVSSRRHKVHDYLIGCTEYLKQVYLQVAGAPLCWFTNEILNKLPVPGELVRRNPKVNVMGYGYVATTDEERASFVGSREECMNYMYHRYGVSEGMVQDFLDLLGDKLEPCTAYLHPLPYILAVRDYT